MSISSSRDSARCRGLSAYKKGPGPQLCWSVFESAPDSESLSFIVALTSAPAVGIAGLK